MTKKTEPYAFPNSPLGYEEGKGMTLRVYIATKAMQGWIASQPRIMGEMLDGSEEMAKVISKAAFVMADAMLVESK